MVNAVNKPREFFESKIPFKSFEWCRSVPNLSTVPPNKLNCTVIFVVIAGSIIAANSWAAKIRCGLFQKSDGRNVKNQ